MWYVAQNCLGNWVNLGREQHVRSAVKGSTGAIARTRILIVDGRLKKRVGKIAVAHRFGGNSGLKKVPLVYWIALIVEEEEEFVFYNRAANAAAVLIPSGRCFLTLIEEISRLEHVVLVEFIERTVEAVCSTLDNDVQSEQTIACLSSPIACVDRNFFNRVDGRVVVARVHITRVGCSRTVNLEVSRVGLCPVDRYTLSSGGISSSASTDPGQYFC